MNSVSPTADLSPGRRLVFAAGVGAAVTLVWIGISLAGAAWLHASWAEGARTLMQSGLLMLVFVLGLTLATVLAWWFSRRMDRQAADQRAVQLRHQGVMQLLPLWYWETDAEHRLSLLRPPRGAPAAEWHVDERMGRPLWEDFHSDPQLWRAFRQMLQARRPLESLPAHRVERDGRRTLWLLEGLPRFDAHGRFLGYQGTARDVSERTELQFDREIGLHLLDAVPSAVLLAEATDGPRARYVVRHCNEVAARHLGEAASRLAGQDLLEILGRAAGWPLAPLCERLGLPAPDQPPPASGWTAHVDAFTFRHGGTERRMLLALFTPVAANAAEVARAERQAAERELESFSYTVSHDLRAPIRVVEGFARILKEDYGRSLDRIGNDHLDRVLGAAARMNGMIDALLALSRLSAQPLQHQPVNLSQLATYIVDDLRRQTPGRVVDVTIAPGLTAEGDPTLLRVALENLLGNAWKYTGKRERAVIEFGARREGQRTVYFVRDNGAGFDMRFADRLFGVFQRLHGATEFQGTGVGLASVQRIIRRHGGQIWAESEVGAGATFYFTLGERPRV
ncbi:MAG TPA: ATP-binding protein [Burkholderiaceae bacterium]|nr:ATP-binding protein [Burkholderiaceae bacterium]